MPAQFVSKTKAASLNVSFSTNLGLALADVTMLPSCPRVKVRQGTRMHHKNASQISADWLMGFFLCVQVEVTQ